MESRTEKPVLYTEIFACLAVRDIANVGPGSKCTGLVGIKEDQIRLRVSISQRSQTLFNLEGPPLQSLDPHRKTVDLNGAP